MSIDIPRDKKIIGLYARGMFTRDIQSELEELYGSKRQKNDA